MELINGNSEIIRDFFQSMDRILDGISRLAKENRPHLNGEKFLSNREAAKCLKVSIRTCLLYTSDAADDNKERQE